MDVVDAPREVTRTEAAEITGRHYNTIRKWEERGRIHPRRAPNGEIRIDVRELEGIMAQGRRGATEDRAKIAALEAENQLLREQLLRTETRLDTVSERYERLLDRVLRVTEPGKGGGE